MATARLTSGRTPAGRPAATRRQTAAPPAPRWPYELGAVACVALAVFLAFVLYFHWKGGVVGSSTTDALRYLFGLLTFATPLLLVYAALALAAGGGRRPLPAATAGVFVLCLAFVLAAAAGSFGLFSGTRPAHLFGDVWMRGHGGALGEALWAGFRYLLGRVGANVVVVAARVS